MQVEVIKATIEQKSVLANLLELYAYDFTEFCDFDIGDDGFYGYERLPLYWTEPTRFPYLIYVDKKIACYSSKLHFQECSCFHPMAQFLALLALESVLA